MQTIRLFTNICTLTGSHYSHLLDYYALWSDFCISIGP